MKESAAELPSSLNLRFVEGLYADYLHDPNSVSEEWRNYFEALGNGERVTKPKLEPTLRPWTIFNPPAARRRTEERRSQVESRMAGMQDRVDQIIRSYRFRGHLIARINPLGFRKEYPPELNPASYGFTPLDMERPFS